MGQVRASMYLPAGYVKLEGATVNRSNYPRLVALADTYSLWTDDPANNPGLFGEGDGSTTMVLPNWTGRMAQFAATAGSKIDAGLPNITGGFYSRIDNNGNGLVFEFNGAFFTDGMSGGSSHISLASGSPTGQERCVFDASRSDPIYSASTTVQPPAINTFAIMRY